MEEYYEVDLGKEQVYIKKTGDTYTEVRINLEENIFEFENKDALREDARKAQKSLYIQKEAFVKNMKWTNKTT